MSLIKQGGNYFPGGRGPTKEQLLALMIESTRELRRTDLTEEERSEHIRDRELARDYMKERGWKP